MTIGSKVYWLFLFAVILTAILLPRPTLAQQEEVDLTLRLRDGWYCQEARAGQDNNFLLEVRNTGTVPITNIRLSSEKPEDWIIEFEPAHINYLDSDSLQIVDINIKPIGKATKAEYEVTLIAEANEIRELEHIRITVKPSSSWLWIWVIVGVMVVAGFVFIFMRFGRRQE